MRSYSVPTQDALAASSIIRRGMILFDFPSGYYGFWDGSGPFVYNTITYQGGAQAIEIETADETLALSSNQVVLRLKANPGLGLTPDVLSTIEAENYHQRPVTISKAIFDRDTLALISVTPTWRGKVDRVEHVRDGGDYTIVGYLESRSIDYSRRGTAMRSDAAQKVISAGDKGLEFTGYGYDAMQIPFGTKAPASFQVTTKPRPVI